MKSEVYVEFNLNQIHYTAMLIKIQPDRATSEGSSCTSIMTCTGGCGYSF